MANQHYPCRCTAEGLENMEDVDLEEQVAPPTLQSPPSSSPALLHLQGMCRTPATAAVSCRALVATAPVRALWMVVLMVGLLFAVHLLAHDLRTFALLVAESLCIFFVMSCVAAWERGDHRDAADSGACNGVTTVALWSFAMALTVTMTFWVAAGMSLPAVAALYLLSLLVVSACFAVLLGT
uniref:Uncharacterized protein n=1 Tax=Leersia perrieri TaxID=77586 RepID=A0A0D9V1C5_9ORYZ